MQTYLNRRVDKRSASTKKPYANTPTVGGISKAHPPIISPTLRLPYIPPCCDSNSHLFYIILPDEATRDALKGYLKKRQIHSVFHMTDKY